MSSLYSSLLTVVIIISVSETQWNITTITSPALTQPSSGAALFTYNGTIHLFGDIDSEGRKRVIDYVISKNMFLYLENALPYDCGGESQHYTQNNNKLYWIQIDTIYSYDYISDVFLQETSAPINSLGLSCLTSYNDLLFVLGGNRFYPNNYVQAFNITSNQWITAVADMIYKRRDFSCVVDAHRGVVYAMSGTDHSVSWLTTIETLAIGDNITTASWVYSGDLLVADWGTRAVYIEYDDSILVTIQDEIERIDCENGAVSWMVDLIYDIHRPGVIFVENVLYIFGGYDSTWLYITNPLVLGTSEPTNFPSIAPQSTFNPTTADSTSFTSSITITNHTAAVSSLVPTEYPSNNPSSSPTTNPSKSPTEAPTPSPIRSPTPSPSSTPPLSSIPSPTPPPTPSPTPSATEVPTRFPTVTATGPQSEGAVNVMEIVLMILGVLTVIAAAVLFMLWYKTKHIQKMKEIKKQKKSQNMAEQNAVSVDLPQITSVNSASSPEDDIDEDNDSEEIYEVQRDEETDNVTKGSEIYVIEDNIGEDFHPKQRQTDNSDEDNDSEGLYEVQRDEETDNVTTKGFETDK